MHCIFHGLIKLQDNSAETLYVSSNVSWHVTAEVQMARRSCCLDEDSEMTILSPEGNSKIVSSVQALICAKYYYTDT